MEIVIGILAVALVICVYIIVNILRKIESKDDQLLEQIDFYIELKSDIDAVYEALVWYKSLNGVVQELTKCILLKIQKMQ